MNLTPKADHINISDLRAAADIIFEKTELITFLGFCKPGKVGDIAETDKTWSILKIEQSGTVKPIITTFKWAEGIAAFSHQFSERETYTYKFKNF